MIHTHTMSQPKQIKETVKVANPTNIASTTAYDAHVTMVNPTSHANGIVIPSGPYSHVIINPLLASFTTSAGIRVTGWSFLDGYGVYIPNLLFAGSIAGVQSTAGITVNSTALKFVHGITVTSGLTAQTLINNSATLSAASIVVPNFGCSHLEVDFISATATADYANFIYGYCSIN